MTNWISRRAESRVLDALEDTPAVLVHGPRQVGKSSLVQKIAQDRGFRAITLDDLAHLEFAQTNPDGFLRTFSAPLLIDEVQRAPGVLLALKAAIDRQRQPGAYLLTGSANVLTLPKVADSLAGRMEIVDLLPITPAERRNVDSDWLERAFDPRSAPPPTADIDLCDTILRGGFPEASARLQAKRRDAWFQAYVRSLLERDVRDLAQIQGLTQLPRLLRTIAARVGETLNISAFSRETGLPATTLERYFDLLRAVFLVRTVPPWTQEPAQAYIRSPKVFLADTGLFAHLVGADERRFESDERARRALLLNFIHQALAPLLPDANARLFHLRTVRHREVDFVLENASGDLVGISLVDGSLPTRNDADGLRYLREIAPARFVRGIVLYPGDEFLTLDEHVEAWPIRTLG